MRVTDEQKCVFVCVKVRKREIERQRTEVSKPLQLSSVNTFSANSEPENEVSNEQKWVFSCV